MMSMTNALFDLLLDAVVALYFLGTLFLVTFVSGFGVLLVIYFWTRKRAPAPPPVPDTALPSVTVQLPVYNEVHVIDRLLDACIEIDYPADKLHIQILDDSTDETTARIRERLVALCAQGHDNLTHLHRENREGYKAGALAYGLRFVQSDFVAIFDADFVPEKDFLRRTMPYFVANPRVGLVQTRWSHLNRDANLLTRAQALNIDAHFGVEQVARSRGRLPMSMNGTGGLWRVAAIRDAGGWSAATLTEDLDLSYRAFMRGWEFLYLVDVAVPGELPPLVQAYKLQQARWATGSTQCLLRHTPRLVTMPCFSPLKKLMGTLHLSQYAVQPVILMLFLLAPLLLVNQRIPDMTLMPLVGILPPLVITVAQIELYDDWRRNLLYFPVQFLAGVAIVVNNTRAVLAALSTRRHEFKRTPKYQKNWQKPRRRKYRLPLDITTVGELLLALYAVGGMVIAMDTIPAFVPYMLSYAVSFTLFALWNIYQHRPG